jgi:hypothetical protein
MAKLSLGRGKSPKGGGSESLDVVLTGVPEMVARLKELDPKLVRDLRKELRQSAEKTASRIRAEIGVTPPISGMANTAYRTHFAGATTSISISLAGNRRRDVTGLLKIKVDVPKNGIGYLIVENAGKRGGAGEGPQGSNLIAVLTDRVGTIKGRGKGAQRQLAWRHFFAEKITLSRAAADIVNDFEKKSTRELDK